MTWDQVSSYGWLLALVFQGIFAWAGWSLRKRFVTREDFEKEFKEIEEQVAKDVGSVRSRVEIATEKIERFEVRLAEMPSQSEIHNLSVALEKLAGQMGGLAERVEAVSRNDDRLERAIGRVEEYLLNGGRK